MIAVAVAAGWAFYGIATWGWVLIKGYDIPFSTWFNPMHPYQWPQGTPPMVPPGAILPPGGSSAAGQASVGAAGAAIATGVNEATAGK